MAAEFPNAAALYHAAEQIRDAGFKRWDVFTPFPVHGMDKAMGLGKSWLSAVVLCGGIGGLLTAVVLESYPSLIDYQTVVHGKPTDWTTVPAFVPIFFELTVLCSAFATRDRADGDEPVAAMESSDVQLGTLLAGGGQRILPCDRGAGPEIFRGKNAGFAREHWRASCNADSRLLSPCCAPFFSFSSLR